MMRTADYKYIGYPNDPTCPVVRYEERSVGDEERRGRREVRGRTGGDAEAGSGWDKRLEKYPGAPVSNTDLKAETRARRATMRRQLR